MKPNPLPPSARAGRTRNTRVLPATALLAIAVVFGCSPRVGTPVADAVDTTDPQLARGQQAFMQHCHQCHPGGEPGLAPGLNDKPLPAFAIRTQVRAGAGAMPAFDEARLPDEELDALAAYVVALRDAAPLSERISR